MAAEANLEEQLGRTLESMARRASLDDRSLPRAEQCGRMFTLDELWYRKVWRVFCPNGDWAIGAQVDN